MDLLQAATNSDLKLAKGGGDITIVGGSALLPETGPVGTMADVSDEFASDSISVYVVHPGDTLSQIAKMYGVTVNTIMWSNDIPRGMIKPGDKLLILPITGVSHTVKSGDTLQTIAKKYKADITEIAQYNNLSKNSVLMVGQIVIVPDGEVVQTVAKASGVTSSLRNAGGPDYSGYYMRPVSGGVRTQGLHGYNGVDLAGPYGTSVYAAAAGQVIIAKDSGWNGGYGNYVVIQHNNGTQTLYSHFEKNLVVSGQYVTQGQTIGLMGATGKATGSHLHFEVRGAKNPF